MELFDWLKTLYEIWKNLNEDTVHLSSQVAMGELVKNGCTTVFDHHYVFPKDSVVQSIDEIMKDSEELVAKYHDTSFTSMKRIALAPCSPFSVSADLLRESAILARKLGVRLHTHLCETKDEEIRCSFLMHRLHSGYDAPTGYDLLKMATMGSARLLGREKEIGSIEVGKCADFFMVDSNRIELVGACYDPKSVFGTVGFRMPVDYTVINGQVTVEQGRLTGVDEARLVEDSNKELKRYLG